MIDNRPDTVRARPGSGDEGDAEREGRLGRLVRRRGRAALLGVALLSGGLFAACGGTNAAGRTACGDVSRSLALYQQSQSAGGAAAAKDRRRAQSYLEQALQPAALASGKGGSLQALATTLEEVNRVPEGMLVKALKAQCAAVDGTT